MTLLFRYREPTEISEVKRSQSGSNVLCSGVLPFQPIVNIIERSRQTYPVEELLWY